MSEVLELLSSELDERKIREIAEHLGTDHAQTEAAIAAALPTLVSAMGRTADTEHGSEMMAAQINGIGGGSLGDILGKMLAPSRNQPSPSPKSNATQNDFDEILPPGFGESKSIGSSDRELPPPAPPSRTNKPSPLDISLGPGNELPSSKRNLPDVFDTETSNVSPSSVDDVLGKVLGDKKKNVERSIGKSSGLDLGKIGPLLVILAPLVLGAMKAKASSKNGGASKIDPSDLSKMMRGERASIEQRAGGSLIGKMLDQDGDGDFDLSDIISLGMKFFFGRR